MKTIALVTTRIDTFSNPTLTFIIEKLIEENYKILFFGFEQMFVPKETRTKIIFFPLPFNFYKFKKSTYSFIKLIKQYYDLYKTLKIRNKVNTIICVDPMGLVIAGRILKLVKVKIVYASFEIFFEEEFFVQKKKILKKLEMKYSRKVDLTITQDERREKLLKSVNNFNSQTKFMQIPVSPKPIEITSNSYNINNELMIPEDKIIVVYSGTLQNWSGISEILNLFPEKWNSDFWLVIHSHRKEIEKSELLNKIDILKKANQNISFHNQPFNEFVDYAKFLSKCHIGIATYFPDYTDVYAGKNMQEIGLSSGKFSTYIMLGIPTIVTSDTTYKELNLKYRFGEIINSVTEIPQALIKIKNNYDSKVDGCKLLYDKVLNPVSKIQDLTNYIDESYNRK